MPCYLYVAGPGLALTTRIKALGAVRVLGSGDTADDGYLVCDPLVYNQALASRFTLGERIMGKRIFYAGLVVLGACWLMACTPKVGSEDWCNAMNDKAKGDWSMNEAADFAKHCVLQ